MLVEVVVVVEVLVVLVVVVVEVVVVVLVDVLMGVVSQSVITRARPSPPTIKPRITPCTAAAVVPTSPLSMHVNRVSCVFIIEVNRNDPDLLSKTRIQTELI